MAEKCENITESDKDDCSDLFNCCDCGVSDGDGCGCGCAYCFSCNACETCLDDTD